LKIDRSTDVSTAMELIGKGVSQIFHPP